MRVLMVDGGDRTPYLSRLVGRLARRGVEMHYAADPRWKDFAALTRDGVACHEIHIRSKLDFRSRFRIRRLLREHRIEVLHAINSRDAYVSLKACGRRRRTRVLVRRGAYPRLSRFDPVARVLYGPRGADRILTVSEDLRRHMIARGVPPERLTTVYSGIWSEEMAPVRRDLRREHGVPEGSLLLGVAGEFRWVKGFDFLLAALARLKERGVPFRLLVAGVGYEPAHGEIEERGLAPHITFLGHLPDVLAFTPNVDCLVVPSRIDALPRVAIEATVLGTPVIATRVGGIPEILDEGRCGVLVDPEDTADLAGALERAAREPAALRALADAALARNRDLFGLDRCVARHLELYGA